MPVRKYRVALYLTRPLDMDAYAALVGSVAHAEVVMRSPRLNSLEPQLAEAEVDIVLVGASLVTQLSESQWADLLAGDQPMKAAIIPDDSLNDSRLAPSRPKQFVTLSNTDHLVALLGGRQLAAGGRGGRTHVDSLGITRRERQVWQLIATGHSVKQVAESLSLAESTIDSHKSRLMRKLDVHKSLELVRMAVRWGIVEP